ncbi:hypothetical protein [Reichenbachiella sp.]|uniref:hypothetical protein n=1 Tax=Reichenbachiella sp. TaxID=2184521 RepID=UPI003BAE5A5C
MKIRTNTPAPKSKEIARLLNSKLPKGSAKLFGFNCYKTILVRTSPFVGVQITRRNHELVIEGSLPSVSASILSSFLMLEGFLYLFEIIFHNQWKNLETEVATLLLNQYK